MDVKELKFLLKLLGYKSYKGSIQKIHLEEGMKASQRDEIFYRLCDRGFVNFTAEVTKFNIEPKGKSLLNSKKAAESLTDEEFQVLKASANGVISPGETGIAPVYRQAVIQDLLDQGFLKIVDQKIKEVWLTEQGKQFLCQEYSSGSNAREITLKMLSDYLELMRTYQSPHSFKQDKQKFFKVSRNKPTDSEILTIIRELDKTLGTDNYLPIFHLRQNLELSLTREELDQALYRLERNDQIELSSLQEVKSYTPEQVEAGIPQDIGGRLFFIIIY